MACASLKVVTSPVELRVTASLWARIRSHMLQEDFDEHGGVIFCGRAATNTRTSLLVRDFIAAIDGVDYVPSAVGYRELTASFIRHAALRARREHLVPLFVHGHGEGDSVEFSSTDLNSHARSYPSLIEITDTEVGAVVMTDEAVAGELWLVDGRFVDVDATVVLGHNIKRFTPSRTQVDAASPCQDRQIRLFGHRGQAILAASIVGVVGVGGAGMLVVEYLSRLGVGRIIAIDPDRVEPANVPRLPGSTMRDTRLFFMTNRLPERICRLGQRRPTPKVKIARRLAIQAGQGTIVEMLQFNVATVAATRALKNCDYIVLAADSNTAQNVVNTIGHQYLIPVIQVGVKIGADDQGALTELFAIVRAIRPGEWCLSCSGIIDFAHLALESMPDRERALADYGTGEPAPSVITLNAIGASNVVTRIMLELTGLMEPGAAEQFLIHPSRGTVERRFTSGTATCQICSEENGVVGLGDLRALKLPSPLIADTTVMTRGSSTRSRPGPHLGRKT